MKEDYKDEHIEKIQRVIELTEIIKDPVQKIATFWNTEIHYNAISPISKNKSYLRKGVMVCKKPTIITTSDSSSFLNNFDEEEIYFARQIAGGIIENLRILGYQFTNIKEKETIINLNKKELSTNIMKTISKNDLKTAVLVTPNDIWVFSLIHLFFNILLSSYKTNFDDLSDRGFFKTEEQRVKEKINILFLQAKKDSCYIDVLAQKLQEYNLFSEYEDQFFQLIKSK